MKNMLVAITHHNKCDVKNYDEWYYLDEGKETRPKRILYHMFNKDYISKIYFGKTGGCVEFKDTGEKIDDINIVMTFSEFCKIYSFEGRSNNPKIEIRQQMLRRRYENKCDWEQMSARLADDLIEGISNMIYTADDFEVMQARIDFLVQKTYNEILSSKIAPIMENEEGDPILVIPNIDFENSKIDCSLSYDGTKCVLYPNTPAKKMLSAIGINISMLDL